MSSVTVWNEFRHEREDDDVSDVYPDGIHTVIADGLREHGHDVRTATLDEPEHGLTEAVLEDTDVLTWWGHMAHDEVEDEIVGRVKQHVLDGMGLVVLHSAHYSKLFKSLMGTTCSLKWREAGETERLWVTDPGHPIASGIEESIELPETEMYGECFDVPQPDSQVFTSWFEGGNVFRSGLCYRRGSGSLFYFRPGHETYPLYEREDIRQILANAVDWATATDGPERAFDNRPEPLEPIE